MNEKQLIDLKPKQLKLLKTIIKIHIPNKTVWAYGSRVTWKASETSDLDLVVFNSNSGEIFDLKESFVESPLLVSVDVMDWDKIPDDFKENIKKRYIVVQQGSIPEGWREVKLGKIAHLAKNPWRVGDEKLPYVGLEHIGENSLRLNSVGSSDSVSSNKFRFAVGDTLFGKLRPYFRKVIKPNFEGVCSTDIWVVRPKENVNKNYLFYFFSNQDLVDISSSSSMGTRMPRADWDFLSETTWKLPPLPEQKAIAEILSSLDDKIELLHRQNKTLEDTAQALFRKWFVEGADERCEERKLGDLVDFNPPYALNKGISAPYLEMKNVSPTTFNPEDWYNREFTSGMKFQNSDTLLARITPCLENGKTCHVMFLKENQIGWGSTEYVVMRMKKPFHAFISYLIAKSPDFRAYAIAKMSGSSGRQRVQANVLADYPILMPDGKSITQLNDHLTPTLDKLSINANQIRTLKKLRDVTLPKLMSGHVQL